MSCSTTRCSSPVGPARRDRTARGGLDGTGVRWRRSPDSVRSFLEKDIAVVREIATELGNACWTWPSVRLTASSHYDTKGTPLMGRVEGKVAFITGAARGQGRSHAVRLAEEGADIIAVDLCRDYETVGYKMATPDDLKETVRLVEAQGRRVVALQSDVRSMTDMREAVQRGVAELGGLDIVVAQAGIAPLRGEPKLQAWCDAVDVDLIGTINAIQAALPQLREGASVIATGSTAALMDHGIVAEPGSNPGGAGYAFAKRALSEYIHELARNLAPLK